MLHLDDVHGHVEWDRASRAMLESLSMRRMGQQFLAEDLRDCHFEAVYLTNNEIAV